MYTLYTVYCILYSVMLFMKTILYEFVERVLVFHLDLRNGDKVKSYIMSEEK